MAKQDQYRPSAGTYLDRDDNVKHVDDGVPTVTSAVKLNREKKVFVIRSAEVTLGVDVATFLKITVPAKKRLIILDRYIHGRGKGTLSLEWRGNTDAVTSPETAFAVNVDVGVSFVQPDTEFEFIGTDISGSNIEPNPSIAYLGDEAVPTASRSSMTEAIPVGYLERIVTNDTDSAFSLGIELLTSLTTNTSFQGYFELFCREEDLD